MGINTEHINTGRIDTGGVWIIVPAFNESTVIGEVITQLRSEFSHVVCVDDGSSDDTASTALAAGAHVVRHPVNLGQGAAIQTGVEYARRQPGDAGQLLHLLHDLAQRAAIEFGGQGHVALALIARELRGTAAHLDVGHSG